MKRLLRVASLLLAFALTISMVTEGASAHNSELTPEMIGQLKHELITSEQIWEEHIAFKAGVVNLTAEIYTEKVYKMERGATPWLICMVAPGVKTAYWHSTHLVKTLHILQTIGFVDTTYAIVETTNELLREAFENRGVP